MRISPAQLRLYAVSDDAWLKGRSLEECVASACRGGATCVQLRRKGATTVDMSHEARLLKSICDNAGVPLIVNDDVESALAAGTGLHVGQDDCDVTRARELLGPSAILGVSTQTVEQALQAEGNGADYLGVGALFKTTTKPEAAEVDISTFEDICNAVSIPVVGIGGMNENTIPLLGGSGASGAAVVSAIFSADDIVAVTSHLRSICDETFSIIKEGSEAR